MNMENIKEKLKQVVKQVSLYSIILISLGAGISIGIITILLKTALNETNPFQLKEVR